jgi:hypothetical protein
MDRKAAIMVAEPETNVAIAAAPAATADPLCWICKQDKADSGEHKTKRSDLKAVLGPPTQEEPFFYHDLHKANRPVGSLDAKILKSPVRICAYCNNTRTQPHDMSDRLRSRRLAVGRWVRCNNIFGYCTKREMLNVHLFLLKLFGCMLAEAKANGYEVPIDIVFRRPSCRAGRMQRLICNSAATTVSSGDPTCIVGKPTPARAFSRPGFTNWTRSR